MSDTDTKNTNEVQIPASEILTLLSSIQLASTRGAFRPEEFVNIGSAYEKLFSFLTDIGVLKRATDQN
jgi:hypothetical protein